MSAKLLFAACSGVVLLVTGCGPRHDPVSTAGDSTPDPSQPQLLVNVGDTQEQVDKALGEPSIEFPTGDKMIRWYADYEVITSNNVVVAVKRTQVESI